MSLKGSRRHAGICVAVMMEKAVVVATAVIVASSEMVAEDVDFLPTGRGEREENRREVPRFRVGFTVTLGLRVSAP